MGYFLWHLSKCQSPNHTSATSLPADDNDVDWYSVDSKTKTWIYNIYMTTFVIFLTILNFDHFLGLISSRGEIVLKIGLVGIVAANQSLTWHCNYSFLARLLIIYLLVKKKHVYDNKVHVQVHVQNSFELQQI